ncbi:MAG: hypothetical protein ACRDPG_05835 [Nocardioidaceae bacterium]
MAQHEVTRTLVKSQPEVWTQCSDANSLGRHLNGSFGEIRITRLEPEHSVAWEGEEVSGTVTIEPSAWGTRVTLSVEMAGEIAELEEAAPLKPPATLPLAAPATAPLAAPPAPPSEPEPEFEGEAEFEAEVEPEPEPEVEPVAMAEPADVVEPDEVVVPDPESPPAAVGEPKPALKGWARFRAWWGRAASLEPPPDEEVPVHGDTVVDDDLPAADETGLVEEPVTEEPELPGQREPEPTVEEPVAEEPEVPVRREPEPPVEPRVEPPVEPPSTPESDTAAVLSAALESLGQAHHRPFSRA